VERPSIVNADGWVHVEDLDPSVMLYRTIGEEEARWAYQQLKSVPTFAVVDVKGGVRKTTLAVHTAFSLHRVTGKRVMLADCDQYHSISDWQKTAADKGDPWPDDIIVVSAAGDNAHFDIIEAVQEYRPDYLGFDTPPNDPAAARRALLGADLLISPSGPYEMDIRRLVYGVQIADEVIKMRGGSIDARVALTGVKMGTRMYEQARQFVAGVGLRILGNAPFRDLGGHAENFGTSLKKLYDYTWTAEDILPIFQAATANRVEQ
jgi:cellulose biosynthesis protein BcsQ